MPRSVADSIAGIIAAEADKVLRRVMPALQKALAEAQASPRRSAPAARMTTSVARPRRRPARPAEITRWVADRRARRVPTFVIDETGLDTKKKIVAKFGENAAFEKGKPLPTTLKPGATTAAPESAVRAKAPILRKAASK
jgi:sRNA-binding protein